MWKKKARLRESCLMATVFDRTFEETPMRTSVPRTVSWNIRAPGFDQGNSMWLLTGRGKVKSTIGINGGFGSCWGADAK